MAGPNHVHLRIRQRGILESCLVLPRLFTYNLLKKDSFDTQATINGPKFFDTQTVRSVFHPFSLRHLYMWAVGPTSQVVQNTPMGSTTSPSSSLLPRSILCSRGVKRTPAVLHPCPPAPCGLRPSLLAAHGARGRAPPHLHPWRPSGAHPWSAQGLDGGGRLGAAPGRASLRQHTSAALR
jgi:hypothetical protein